jgi:hypothetical protein
VSASRSWRPKCIITIMMKEKSTRFSVCSVIWGTLLLFSCSNPSRLAITEQNRLNCRHTIEVPVNMESVRCTRPFLDLQNTCEGLQQTCTSESEQLQKKLKHYEKLQQNCTSDIEQLQNNLTHYTEGFPRFNDPNRPMTQRDSYNLTAGVAIGVMGLWMCQKMLGSKRREEVKKEVEKEVERLKKEMSKTKKIAILASEIAQSADKKAGQAMETASRAESRTVETPAHVIPQHDK